MSVIVDHTLKDPIGTRKLCVVCSRYYRGAMTTCPDDGTVLVVEAGDDSASYVGRVLGHYRLVRLLGEGGASAVFEAVHVRLDRRVALKLLHRDLVDQEMVTRFFNEARAVNQIRHPNIIDIEDFVHAPTGEHYMIMELLKGEDLRAKLDRERKLSPENVAELGAQIASALAAVHKAGIIHRDLKPDNIFLVDKQGTPIMKLLDFGVAKFVEERQGVTRVGMTMGTPQYMAPEQIIVDGVPDHRSDIYALGMLMYEALTGRPAFTGAVAAILRAHLTEPVTPPTKLQTVSAAIANPIPEVLEAAILKCLEKDPANRFADADELRIALRGERPVARMHTPLPFAVPKLPDAPSRKRGPALVVGTLLVAAAAAGAFLVMRGSDDGPNTAAAAASRETAQPSGEQQTKPTTASVPAAPATIKLVLTSTPEGAEIFLGEDRKPLGKAPVTVSVPASNELVPLVAKFADGDEVVEKIILNRPLELALEKPAPPPPPVATRPTPVKRDDTPATKPITKPTKKPAQATTTQGRDDTVDPFTFK